jgi:hypothetical protein
MAHEWCTQSGNASTQNAPTPLPAPRVPLRRMTPSTRREQQVWRSVDSWRHSRIRATARCMRCPDTSTPTLPLSRAHPSLSLQEAQ